MSKNKTIKQETQISTAEQMTDAAIITVDSKGKNAKEKAKKEPKATKSTKGGKDVKNSKSNKKNSDKESLGKKIKRKTRETTSELKKVTWPSFASVCKKTGVVLSVVILFGLVLFGIDMLFGYLFGLLTG